VGLSGPGAVREDQGGGVRRGGVVALGHVANYTSIHIH
jgi:hypothetical protein